MLRVHLTAEDLSRVRIAKGPALMWEITLSLHWLPRHSAGPPGQQWRHRVAPSLPRSTQLLTELIPPRGYFPDFLTPHGPSDHLTAAVDPVLGTSVTRLRHDLTLLCSHRRPSPWIRNLATGDSTALQQLGRALHAYHHIAVAPFWPHIQRHLAHERDRTTALIAHGGTHALLTHSPLPSAGSIPPWKPTTPSTGNYDRPAAAWYSSPPSAAATDPPPWPSTTTPPS